MDLTLDKKEFIDSLDYANLLSTWKNAPVGDPWFQGETGMYWINRISKLRAEPGGYTKHVAASKLIGWG